VDFFRESPHSPLSAVEQGSTARDGDPDGEGAEGDHVGHRRVGVASHLHHHGHAAHGGTTLIAAGAQAAIGAG
jgi:hypothetical protein